MPVIPPGETILLSGQDGPAFFLVPVMDDVITEDQELRMAIARASLRHSQRIAMQFPISEEEIEAEIQAARSERRNRNPL